MTTELFSGIYGGRSINVVGVDSVLDVLGSMLGPSLESLLVAELGGRDRGTKLGSLRLEGSGAS
jgi:hypothetical protein